MSKIYNNLIELVGNTPVVRLNKLGPAGRNILLKLESFNPGGSVKDRIAKNMIEEAEASGALKPGDVIIEPTSGNTGVGLAFISAVKGYKLILTMPDTMSMERRKLLIAYGAELVLTPGAQGMKGAIGKVDELKATYPNHFIPQQFTNPDNPDAHRKTTALEILEQTDGDIDIFVSGVGTGGTITGVGEVLKEKLKDIKIIAVEPSASPVLSGGQPGPHKLQGIGAGFVPDVLNKGVIDEVYQVDNEDAFSFMRALAKEEGILVGISSAAVVKATIEIAKRPENEGKTILTLLPDTGERYLSMDIY
ncbi:cysteine synthase A [Petrocella sp. FN5]|uniref:cysteine synthase A n=1 Tax=Petrocella sp. FN5 TaxID=3032002 RepID=UPI0023DC2A67|nr:cysteine synthase A [Petrocella sp. FN5]MDF1616990.1 cysteine synthase A [Petrocella sp. FN5]